MHFDETRDEIKKNEFPDDESFSIKKLGQPKIRGSELESPVKLRAVKTQLVF